MKISGLCCTKGRFKYLKRLLTCFVNQEYSEKQLLIYNNSSIPIEMEPIENVILINNHIDYETNQPYRYLSCVYRDALRHIQDDVQYISLMDDDDVYLPRHFVRSSVSFSENQDYYVWKPKYFFLKTGATDISYLISDNFNLEGGCVVNSKFLKSQGFDSTSQPHLHLKWLQYAEGKGKVFSDDNYQDPTYCYDFSQSDVYHVSNYNDPDLNKVNSDSEILKMSDFGSGQKLVPWPKQEFLKYLDSYFNLEDYKDEN